MSTAVSLISEDKIRKARPISFCLPADKSLTQIGRAQLPPQLWFFLGEAQFWLWGPPKLMEAQVWWGAWDLLSHFFFYLNKKTVKRLKKREKYKALLQAVSTDPLGIAAWGGEKQQLMLWRGWGLCCPSDTFTLIIFKSSFCQAWHFSIIKSSFCHFSPFFLASLWESRRDGMG